MIPGKWHWINEKYERKILSSTGWHDEDKCRENGERKKKSLYIFIKNILYIIYKWYLFICKTTVAEIV